MPTIWRVAAVGATLFLLAAGPPASAATCGPVEALPDEGHHHLVGDGDPPVAYGSVPPTSGWHFRGQALLGVHDADAPLTEPHHVSVLAVGGVVVSYRDLHADEVAELEQIVGRESEAGRPVALTPYDALEEGEVALTAWTLRQRCDGVDGDAVAAFIDDHAADEPDFAMTGEHAHAAPAAPDDRADAGGSWAVLAGALVLLLFALGAWLALRSAGSPPTPPERRRAAARVRGG